ncbi:MAG: hypothetical protein LBB22_03660, partial [Treponema sp.]|nr:hypothetical protein [Treponema sp.]
LTSDTDVYAQWDEGTVSIEGITVKYGSITAKLETAFAAGRFAYTVKIPDFVNQANDVIEAAVTGATVTYSKLSPVKTKAAEIETSIAGTKGTSASVTVAGNAALSTIEFTIKAPGNSAVSKTYRVTPSKESKSMATGGTVTYVRTGSGNTATWDEVHVFKSGGDLNITRAPAAASARVLVVAGGGGGGGNSYQSTGGGGGAGGMIEKTSYTLTAKNYEVTVGAGGSCGSGDKSDVGGELGNGKNGENSKFDTVETIGGGGGGSHSNSYANTGNSGGSGGGGKRDSGTGSQGAPGKGTSGQGYDGGNGGGSANDNDAYSSGGGGGADGKGGNAPGPHKGGNGGPGKNSDITGTSTGYAGGGAGGKKNNTPTASHGGGAASAGVDGTGGGGAGGGINSEVNGYKGGSGIVVVRFPFKE